MIGLGLLLAAAYLVGLPIVAIMALSSASRLRGEVGALRADFAALRRQLGGEPPVPEAEAAREAPPAAEEPLSALPAEEPQPAPPAAAPAMPAAAMGSRLEETLTSRWLVWLGAVSLALAGAFFVGFAIEQGWLGPAARSTVGFLAGLLLIGGGEWLRRRPLQRAIAAVRPDYVPPALASAGLFTAFASVFAAHAQHGLIGPAPAFVLMAAVAFVGVGLSLLQGWFVAAVGIVGAFLAPALVASTEPSALILFPYLGVVTLASLALVRLRAWWWLGQAAVAGIAIWTLLWFATAFEDADLLPIGIVLLIAEAALLALADRSPAAAPDAETSRLRLLLWAGAGVFTLLVFALVRMGGYGSGALALLALHAMLQVGAARVREAHDGLAALAAALVLALLATWHLPGIIAERWDTPPLRAPLLPPELWAFVRAGILFGALFAAAGFAGLWGARRPGLWAGVSAGVPVLVFAIAYWRVLEFGIDLRWALAALGLAALALGAAARVAPWRGQGLGVPLGLYAAGVTAALSLGAAMTLREAWLTVALAVQLPALAWIERRTGAAPLRAIAAALAGVVLVRLALNPAILAYPVGAGAGFGWVLYGYGLSGLMFALAARLFARASDDLDLLVTLLRAGAIAFVVLLATFEIRLAMTGAIGSPSYDLGEQGLQSIAWLAIAWALRVRGGAHPASVWGSRLLVVLASANLVLLPVTLANPIFTHEPVGANPVFNLLLLAYAVPALLLFLIARQQVPGRGHLENAAGILAVILVFAYLSLEVRRLFQGPILAETAVSDAEYYAYSIVWLLYAGCLLAAGIVTGAPALRYASAAVLFLTIAKVFLSDMADLSGLLRVASFLGLGLSLVAIGWLYQRFVFAAKAPVQDG